MKWLHNFVRNNKALVSTVGTAVLISLGVPAIYAPAITSGVVDQVTADPQA